MADEASAEAENGFSPAEEDHQEQNNFFLLLLLRPYVGHALITAAVCVAERGKGRQRQAILGDYPSSGYGTD